MASTPTYDGLLQISFGRSRWETNWKNTEIAWSDLLKRLSKTTPTSETYDEYMSFTPKLQDEKKDVGGFVGGIINKGRRLSTNITSRHLLTLDIDFGGKDFWTEVIMAFPNAAAIYGTHKHHPTHPRYRLVMPLSRQVFADEYQAIARKVAETLDIEVFDITTYQPERLMYWPSTPKDQPYYYEWHDGPWLDADAVLGQYIDWTDVSQWPISKRERAKVSKMGEKQGEPTEKPGVVGAFCRCYSITEALETYLSDVYAPTADGERWSFIAGSTSGGLVLYEDKWAFSHHGTDPISGRLCNAFDLVRHHKFGKLDDESVAKDTPVHKRPSHLAMEEFAMKDKRVSVDLLTKRMTDTASDFADIDFTDAENTDWLKKLEVDKKGRVLCTSPNIVIILENDPNLKGCFKYNLFENREVACRDLPWRTIKKYGDFLEDSDDAAFRVYLERNYSIVSTGKASDAFRYYMLSHQYHPIKEYFARIGWDGEARLDTLLIDFFGAEDNEYVRAVTRKCFVAAVARVHIPGIKYDNILTLVGPQGIGKSWFIGKMGMFWYSDTFSLHNIKEAMEQLQGVWIMEIAEMAAFKKADIDAVKQFTASQTDRFRVAYGKRTASFPRQIIFIGNTNKDDFLTDQTGNRRFWAVKLDPKAATKNVYKELTPGFVNQVWAEALHYYHEGEELFLNVETESIAKDVQESHMEQDPRQETIETYLAKPLAFDWAERSIFERRAWLESPSDWLAEGSFQRVKVSPIEVWCEAFGKLEADASYYNTRFIRDYLAKHPHWEKRVIRTWHYGSQRGFVTKGWDML